MKYFSLFSGIGGFELGIQRVCIKNLAKKNESRCQEETNQKIGSEERQDTQCFNRYPNRFTCVGFSEIDKYAIQVYKKHFPTHKEYGNVQEIKWNDVEDFELLVGGFPCQSFSIAGKRRGFDDTRGTLFFEIARAAQEKQPRLLLLENVKGLLSHDKGQTFGTILHTLDELGYDLQWQVLNSKNFGVPQNRERVFIVGHLRGTGRPQVFPLRQTNESNIQQNKKLQMQSSNTLRTNYSSGYSNETYVSTNKQDSQPKGDKPDSSNSIRRATYTNDMQIRRLTPTECERLQGFPSIFNWEKKIMTRDELCVAICEDGKIIIDAGRGKVYSSKGKEVNTKCNGYFVGNLSAGGIKKQIRLHRLIWISQNGVIPSSHVIHHKNHNKKDNRIKNLECITSAENSTKASQESQYLTGQDNSSTKIDFQIAENIRKNYREEKISYRKLAEKYGLSKSRIGQIINKQGWTEGISDTQRYKCLGNAVTVNVVQAIAERLL